MKTNIISVKYEDRFKPKSFGGKAYNYYTSIDVKVGDLVIAPTSNGEQVAMITELNVPEKKLGVLSVFLKTIEQKIDKPKYLYDNTIQNVA